MARRQQLTLTIPDAIAELARLYALLATPTRLRMLTEFYLRGELEGVEFIETLGLTQATVSYHLGRLWQAGLVTWRRVGPRIPYKLTAEGERLIRLIEKQVEPAKAAGRSEKQYMPRG